MTEDYTPEYVARLRAMLNSQYGTMTQAARETGIPYSTLAKFATGRKTSAERLDQIARALGHRIVLANERDPDPHTNGGSDE